MAIFRKIHTSFWSDSFISELDKEKKLFFIYLLTNERTSQCGIYEITKKQISFDLEYSIDTVSILLEYFIKQDKIRYNTLTNELAIKNWLKFNGSTSPKVESCIQKEFKLIKDTLLIEYIKSIDTHPQEEQEQEQEQEQETYSSSTEKKSQKIKNDDEGEIIRKKVAEGINGFSSLSQDKKTLCDKLISNEFRYAQIDDEILTSDLIKFCNKENYLKWRTTNTKLKIPDVFYFAPNASKFYSLWDVLFYLTTDQISLNQIKTATKISDIDKIKKWIRFYADHFFGENMGLSPNEISKHMKRCWSSYPGENFRALQK